MLFEKFCEVMDKLQRGTFEEFEKARSEMSAMCVKADESFDTLNIALVMIKQVYEEEGLTHYTTESGESEVNPTFSIIVDALQQKSGLTQRAPDVCACGHSEKQHSFFEDHSECDVCQCENGFTPVTQVR